MIRLGKRGFSTGPKAVVTGGSLRTLHLVTKFLGASILGLAGYFGYQTYTDKQTKVPPIPKQTEKRVPAPAIKPSFSDFVVKEVGDLGGKSSSDFRKFVESEGKWNPVVPKKVVVSEPVSAPVMPKPQVGASLKAEPVHVAVEAARPSPLESQIKQLEASLSKTKSELQAEQTARELELIKRLEDTINAQMQAALPKLAATLSGVERSSTAKTLVSHMDFSKNTIDDVKHKMEEVITAYEHRIESLGLTHFDLVSEKLKMQKEKWRKKLEDVQVSFAEELKKMADERDDQWRHILTGELSTAESHFSLQSELDRTHTRQETELDLTLLHKKEVEEITDGLKKATEERMTLLNEILDRLKEMENIQEEHARIIEKLKQVHQLHVTVENLQRTMTQDQGTLTEDLNRLKDLADRDEVVAAAMVSLADVYPQMVERGIPTLGQLLSHFKHASGKARLAALIREKTFWGYVNARLTYMLLPSSIGAVDDGDTFSLLRAAESSMERGDIRHAAAVLKQLQGYPREEFQSWLSDAGVRLAVAGALEALAEDAVALVNDLTKKQVRTN